MKLSEAVKEIIQRVDEDFESTEYQDRAGMLFKSTISTLIKNPEFAFTEQDYSGLVVIRPIREGDVLLPSCDSLSDDWTMALDVYLLLNAYHYSPDPRVIRICDNLRDFNDILNSVYTKYDNRVAFVQVGSKIFTSVPLKDGSGISLSYVRHLMLNDQVFGSNANEKELEHSFSLKFINTAIQFASEQLSAEIKGKDA